MRDRPLDDTDDTSGCLWLVVFLIEGLIACIPAAQRFDSQSTEFALFVVILIWLAVLGLFVGEPVIVPVWFWAQRVQGLSRRVRRAVAIGGIAGLIAALIALGWLLTLVVVSTAHAFLGPNAGLGLFGLIVLSPVAFFGWLGWRSSRHVG